MGEGFRSLPGRERQLVELLLDPAQPTYAQISEQLGTPMGAIGPVRHRAIRRLRALLVVRDGRAERKPRTGSAPI